MWLDLYNWYKSHKNWNQFYCFNAYISLALARNAKHVARYVFTEGLLLSLSDNQGALKDFWGQWMAVIRMWVVPDCCQSCLDLSCRLSLILSLTKDTVLCSNGRYNLPSSATQPTPTHPNPLPPAHPYNMPSVTLQLLWKNALNPVVLAS